MDGQIAQVETWMHFYSWCQIISQCWVRGRMRDESDLCINIAKEIGEYEKSVYCSSHESPELP